MTNGKTYALVNALCFYKINFKKKENSLDNFKHVGNKIYSIKDFMQDEGDNTCH